jgi:LmbE family N-acetylglucosaminyl deacetylase
VAGCHWEAGGFVVIRSRLGHHCWIRTVRRAAPLPPSLLDRPSIVVAPHPDDETLGCGGLVALQRRRGVRVTVVFVTDGAGSHAADPQALARQRRGEARTACGVLGVDPDDVYFLGVADGAVAHSLELIADRLTPIAETRLGHQLVLPHPAEPPSDHAATFDAVDRCVRRLGRRTDALLYPVWLWDQWPFTNPLSEPRGRSSRRVILRTAMRHRLGLALHRALDHRLDITDVIEVKRAALDAHASQMSRSPDAESWLTLADIAGGAWLELLLRATELYGLASVGVAAHTHELSRAP